MPSSRYCSQAYFSLNQRDSSDRHELTSVNSDGRFSSCFCRTCDLDRFSCTFSSCFRNRDRFLPDRCCPVNECLSFATLSWRSSENDLATLMSRTRPNIDRNNQLHASYLHHVPQPLRYCQDHAFFFNEPIKRSLSR